MGLNSESIKVLSNTTKTQASNLSSVKVVAAKRFEDVVVESRAGSTANGTTFITSKSRSTINIGGEIVSTGVNSDIALEGSGMFVVSATSAGERVFTRRGDFRQDELGFWKNGANQLLMAWELDEKGNVPQNASLLSSLKAVNFANTKGDPRATTSISIAMNLNANQTEIRGAGPLFSMQRTGLNSTTARIDPKEILFPEVTTSGSIQLGDRFDIQSVPPGTVRTLEFGGMSVGKAPSSAINIAGATGVNSQFTFGNGPGQMPIGGTLRITIGGANGQTLVFSAVQGSPNTSKREFNNITTLANAINKTSALISRIDSKGNIHIGSTDPNLSIDFVDGNGSTLAKQLGLKNVGAAAGDVERFNSLASLQKAVNKDQNNVQLKAAIVDGEINITSLDAQNDFKIRATSTGIHKIRHATLGDGTIKGQGTVTITAPNNGLVKGDFVRLQNTGNGKLPDGLYFVGAANDREFQVSLYIDDPAANAAAGGDIGGTADGYPVPPPNVVNSFVPSGTLDIIDQPNDLPNGPVWTKVAGKKYQEVTGTVGDVESATNVTINLPAGNVGTGIDQINANDVVYISGAGSYNSNGTLRTLPDGYYRVQSINGGDIRVKFRDAPVGGAVAGVPNTLSVTKVGNKVAADDSFAGPDAVSTQVFESTVQAGGTNFLRVHLPNNNYSRDDYIAFEGLPEPYALAGVTVKNDFKYKILNSTSDYVDIEALDANDQPTNTILVGNLNGTRGWYNHGAIANNGQDVTDAFRINYFSRALEFFKVPLNNTDPINGTVRNGAIDDTFEKTYDRDNVEKSLSSGNFEAGEIVFTQTLKAFDSLGDEYNLLAHFAKLNDGTWAAEVAGIEDPATATFDIENLRADGFIQGGIVTFDQDGNFVGAGDLEQPVAFTRKNGSAPISLTIDWRNQLGTIKNGTVSQFAKDNNFEFTQQDGQASGTLVDIRVTEEGKIVGTYDSGETRDLYQIPVATFPNINGLVPGFGGTYRISRESGELLLKSAGANGAAKTIGGALEATNTDTTAELLTVKETSLAIQANSRVVGVQAQDQKTILAETQ